jgi:DNA polymerase-3 subunit delta
MSATKSILEVKKQLKQQKFLPVYFLFGDDNYLIDKTAKDIEDALTPHIASDFDKQVFYGSTSSINEIIHFSLSYPFGAGKKFVLVKEFEKVNEKEKLVKYINTSPDFTVLVLLHNEAIKKFDKEYLELLIGKGELFEAKELKQADLVEWLVESAEDKGKILPRENANLLVDIVGEDRNLLEMQMNKIFAFLKNEKEITFEIVKEQAIATKEFTIFDLFNAVGKKNKDKAFTIAYNLLEREDILMIISMLNKYFTGLAQIPEMTKENMPDQAAARIVGTHPYYYRDYKDAAKIYTLKRIYKIAQALLEADLAVKTSATDEKTILSVLLTKILE